MKITKYFKTAFAIIKYEKEESHVSIQPIEGKILDYFDDSDLSTAFDTRLQTLWDHLSPYERDAIHHIEQAMFPDDTLTRQRSTQALLLLKFWQAEVDLTNELEVNFKS